MARNTLFIATLGCEDVGMEKIFLKRVTRVRRRELTYITAVNVLNSLNSVIIHMGPYLVSYNAKLQEW